jgi:DNA-binding MarR family transcriptional regulator
MLLYFSRRGSLPLGKVGGRLQVHPTSVTNLIDGLEKADLVRREPHESDRRTTLATITKAGRDAAEEATRRLNAAEFGTAPLSRSELETISGVLQHLRADADSFEV